MVSDGVTVTAGELPKRPAARLARRALSDPGVALLIAVLAIAVRLGVIHSSGGIFALNGYDDGVYFTAATALTHGLIPYRDFVLLHPPGIAVLGAGPIWLAHLLGATDSQAFATMRLLFVALGGLNAALVFRAGAHLSRTTGVVAGCLYAAWSPAIREERTMLLEVIVTLGTVAALALVPAVSRTRPDPGPWRPLVAGALGGLAVTTKLWAALPVAVILGALLLTRRWRVALGYAGAAAASAALIVGPFVMLAGSRVWTMVVASQAQRAVDPGGRLARVPDMLNLTMWPFSLGAVSSFPTGPVDPRTAGDIFLTSARDIPFTATVVLVGALITLIAFARLPPARTWVVLMLLQGALLMAVPIFYDGYANYVAPAVVLVAGAAAHLLWERLPAGLAQRMLGASAAVALGAAVWGAAMADRGAPIRPPIAPLVASARCVASDSPAAIALSDRLTPNIANGCTLVADFSGVVYTLPREGSGPIGPTRLRRESQAFQLFAREYFASADYVILRRRLNTGLDDATLEMLLERPLLRERHPRVFGPPVPGS